MIQGQFHKQNSLGKKTTDATDAVDDRSMFVSKILEKKTKKRDYIFSRKCNSIIKDCKS